MKKKLLMFLLAGSMVITSTGFAELGTSTVYAAGDLETDADEDVQEAIPPEEEIKDEEIIEEVEEMIEKNPDFNLSEYTDILFGA